MNLSLSTLDLEADRGPKPQGTLTDPEVKYSVKKWKHPTLFLFLSFAVYSVYWSFVSIYKYYAFQATIYDLGLSMQNLWEVLHWNWSTVSPLILFMRQGISFVIFPLQFAGYVGLLVFQATFLSLGSVFLYLVGIRLIGNRTESLLISVSYLLYFPLSGVNWFDFHFQALFIPLFLGGFYYYTRGNYVTSSVFFILSGMTRYPYAIFPLMFWLMSYLQDYRSKKVEHARRYVTLLLVNISFYLTLLVIGYFVLRDGYIVTHLTSQTYPLLSLENKLFTLVLVGFPLLFLPFLSRKWAIFLVPYVSLLFISNNIIFQYPEVFTLQYSASYIPFLFLGLIDVLATKSQVNPADLQREYARTSGLSRKLVHKAKRFFRHRLIYLIFTACLISGLFYQTSVPMHQLMNNGSESVNLFNLHDGALGQYYKVASLVPRDDPYVLLQNNIPQFLPGVAGLTAKVPGVIGPNITYAEIAENTFPYVGPGGLNTTPIDYVIMDLNSPAAFQGVVFEGFPGMDAVSFSLISSQMYKVVGQATGFLVLGRNFTGTPTLYTPLEFNFNRANMGYYNDSTINDISSSVTGNLPTLFSRNLALAPGSYNLTINVSSISGENGTTCVGLIGANYAGAGYMPIFYNCSTFLPNSTHSFSFDLNNTFSSVYVYIAGSFASTAGPGINVKLTQTGI